MIIYLIYIIVIVTGVVNSILTLSTQRFISSKMAGGGGYKYQNRDTCTCPFEMKNRIK